MVDALKVTFKDCPAEGGHGKARSWNISRRIDAQRAPEDRMAYCSLKRERRVIIGLLTTEVFSYPREHLASTLIRGNRFLVEALGFLHVTVHVLLQIC